MTVRILGVCRSSSARWTAMKSPNLISVMIVD